MQRAKLSMPFHSCCTSATVGPLPPPGSKCWQAWVAASKTESLTPSCRGVCLGIPSLPAGSGKFGTPRERTQREKATSWEFTSPPAFCAAPEPVDDGLAPHAAASRTTAVAAMAAAVRAVCGIGFMRQFYVRAGDISAAGDVARMSWRPRHDGGMRVLVVEDHATLADRIAQGLCQAGMAVDAVHDGAAALEAAAETAYDVIVLDRDLPVVHGDRVCRVVAGSGPRILMLTAAADVDDRVDGFELGADDYLGKPFAFAELVARVRALSRRGPSVPPVLRRGDLTVDRARHRASRGGRPLSLTRKEFGILEMLVAADGALVSAEELLEHVWDAHADPFSNIVSVTMARLRRKLGDPPLIETVVGKGYRM
jgi:DNA-binding response OmpR family regulator